MACGLGLVGVHLLASTTLGGASRWTVDNHLRLATRRLGIEFGQQPAGGQFASVRRHRQGGRQAAAIHDSALGPSEQGVS